MERAAMYTTPISRTIGLERIFRSSSAPDKTKNRMLMGDTQRSRRSISSSEVGQMLQNTVPVIMQTSSSEKATDFQLSLLEIFLILLIICLRTLQEYIL